MLLHSKLFSYIPSWSRHYIAIVAMACLCALLGWPSYAVGTESLIIAGAAKTSRAIIINPPSMLASLP